MPYIFRPVRKRNPFKDKDATAEQRAAKKYCSVKKGWGVFGSIYAVKLNGTQVMIKTDTVPQKVLDFIEQQITKVIAERIERDPDVADAYLRVLVDGNKFTIKALYIEEHFDEHQDEDVPLLDLMIDRNNLEGHEYWEPDAEAIHELVQSFRNITTVTISLN